MDANEYRSRVAALEERHDSNRQTRKQIEELQTELDIDRRNLSNWIEHYEQQTRGISHANREAGLLWDGYYQSSNEVNRAIDDAIQVTTTNQSDIDDERTCIETEWRKARDKN